MITFSQVQETVEFIQKKTKFSPSVGIILGTGLGGLVNEVKVAHVLHYEEIPHFPVSTVESHSGKLIMGELGGKSVVVMQGRFHYYEGYSLQHVTFPVRVMKLLGIQALLISNAAGGLNPDYSLSDLMALNDHINLMPANPLTGKNMDEMGSRFPDMFEPYSQEILQKAHQVAQELGIRLREGVYVAVSGPNLETRAEYRFLRMIGADAVGMSTVPENIVARQIDLPVFAVSVITDLCAPAHLKPVSIAEVLAAAAKAEPQLTALFKGLVRAL